MVTKAIEPFYLESAINPDTAQAIWRSTSTIFSIVVGSISGDVILFSTANTTPSEVQMPMAVDPNLMASIAYSTWNSLPSGLKVFTPRSYSERVRNICGKQQFLKPAGVRLGTMTERFYVQLIWSVF